MSTGKIGVTTENIFPVIKKFLYSDNEIFLRELVSNAVDATRKIQTLHSFGEFKGDLGRLAVEVKIDKEAGTLTVSDHGIGMDASDIEKYINQIAFSGAEEFLEKYKDTANSIIGHFGLGFYSAFMVAKKVEIRSLSYKEGAEGVEWTCDGSPEFEMHPIEKKERGTDIILYIDDESKEYLDENRIETLLQKYCRFLPVPVLFGKKKEWKDGKLEETDEDNVVNATEPLWTRKPTELTDEDYLKFYRELMPGKEDPLFWIHLNVDYPFTLTGVLYFPKVKSNIDLQRNRIQLYCNQVYVTDQVEGVVPEFMTIMQGVIDSPDIPLNVSRSYLQADRQVKQISSYISKKVAEKLDKLFKNNRAEFEKKWDDIKIFIEYGMLTDEKFYESAKKFYLLKDVKGTYYSLDEYKKLVEASQTDKEGTVIYLYTTDPTSQYTYIQRAEEKGYSVLVMDGELDEHFMSMLESKDQKLRFVRVDSEIPERLIVKEDAAKSVLTPEQIEKLQAIFSEELPKNDKMQFIIAVDALGENTAPATVVQNEFTRRMKKMAEQQPGMSFMGDLPDSYQLVVNADQPAVHKLLDTVEAVKEKKGGEKNEDGKENENGKENVTLKVNMNDEQKALVSQIIDLALLQSGLLQGKELADFISRSIKLL